MMTRLAAMDRSNVAFPMTTLPTLPSAIQSYLQDFVFRARRLALARTMAVAFSTFLAWAFLWCAIDRYGHLAAGIRFVALVMGIALFVYQVAPKILAMRRTPDWLAAATAVEQRNPRFAQRLVTV